MVSRLASFQHAFVQRLSELGIAYRGSPIVEGPGKRYIDDSIRGGGGILNQFLLMIGNDVDPSASGAAKRLVGAYPGLVELRPTRQDGVLLVRPDGYVASTARRGRGVAAMDSMRALLQRQTA
jgi:hypothetical protein